jgi:hypothetical protein
MKTIATHDIRLPIRGRLTPAYVSSGLIAILMAASSAAGLLDRTILYPTEDLRRAFVPNDVVNLCLGLPILLLSMGLARRGKWVGLLCWPGALFFILYNYLSYVFAIPLTAAFLADLLLVMLSAYTLIGLVANFDGNALRQELVGRVPEKIAGGILAGLGILFFFRAAVVFIQALAIGTPLAASVVATNVSDALITPAWIVGGVLLWRRKALGYAGGLGLLFQASMLFIGLIVFLLLQPLLTAASFDPVGVVAVFLMGLICFIPFALFLRGVILRPVFPPE